MEGVSESAFRALEARLKAALAQPLAGAAAHLALAPRPPRPNWVPGRYPPEARPAAALLLLYPADDEVRVVLTVRAADLPHHSRQVSLPGGALDAGETVEAAALREAREEIALDPAVVRLLGRLSPLHIPVSGFVLFPVVGVTDRPPTLRPARHEVARIVHVSLERLADPATLRIEQQTLPDGSRRTVPYFAVEGEKVWGATAMVLAELLAALGQPVRTPQPGPAL
jgi:8-oxo-dGTP pyrophosphatase MutT (NUDIX family)